MMEYSEKEDANNILPDTNIDRERTLTGKWALAIMVSWKKLFSIKINTIEFIMLFRLGLYFLRRLHLSLRIG